MSTDASLELARWRDGTQHLHGHPNTEPLHAVLPPRLSASTATDRTSTRTGVSDSRSPDACDAWGLKSSGDDVESTEHTPARLITPQLPDSSKSTYCVGPHQRPRLLGSGDLGPMHLANAPATYDTLQSPWRDFHKGDRRASASSSIDVPPVISIPRSQDLTGIVPAFQPPSYADERRHNVDTHRKLFVTTSLPSFATLQESTNRRDDADGPHPERNPTVTHLMCQKCTEVIPLLTDIADTVAELDEQVQVYCNKDASKFPDFPKDDVIKATQWIQTRLQSARLEFQNMWHRTQQVGVRYPPQAPVSSAESRPESPSNPLKRTADSWTSEDQSALKRPRSGASTDHQLRLPFTAPVLREDRRLSIDFTPRDTPFRTGYTSPPAESQGTAYPRASSPLGPGRPFLALPSPLSLATQSAVGNPLPPQAAPSIGSPTTSYHPGSSIHSASTNSATSAHIADLQHQVTLKSLALQTLQSEYASLLQKLQRERVKSQTIEKKTSVADQEVNELTGKNEELMEQLKALESQLEQREKRRESERQEASREKEQWARMLEMSGRLHLKISEDKQRLFEEKEQLLQRIAAYEQEAMLRFEQTNKSTSAGAPSSEVNMGQRTSRGGSVYDGRIASEGAAVAYLRKELSILRSKNETLRVALESARRLNRDLDEKVEIFLQERRQANTTLDQILDEEEPTASEQDEVGKNRERDEMADSSSFDPEPIPPLAAAIALDELSRSSRVPFSRGVDSQPATSTLTKWLEPAATSNNTVSTGVETGGPSSQSHTSANSGNTPLFPSALPRTVKAISTKQPYHHVPSPYASSILGEGHAGSSPHSYHSSPGPLPRSDDETSDSPASSKRNSPDASASDSEIRYRKKGLEPSADGNLLSWRPYEHPKRNITAMLPPPRPPV